MLSNYIKVALRSLLRSRINSAITIGGLSLALCVSLLILLFVTDELGYDAHHKDADRIFRLSRATSAASSAPIAPAMESLAGIEQALRIQVVQEVLVRPPSGERFTSRLFFADSNYFEMFDHRFLVGTPGTALASPEAVVLTESSAMRFFGSTDVLGQPVPTEVYGSELALIVSAVIEDTPRKS
ncbi:ABC transporter permease, partial [Rhodothermus sp. AH-315-K08]|nr:ABC transporter permease [Rhodothermus sp. AH-315-K08]